MSFPDDKSRLDQVTFCVDPGSLQSMLALDPTRKLGMEMDIGFDILPVLRPLSRLAARDRQPDDDALSSYRARRATARQRYARVELERDCERLGLTPDQAARQIDGTSAAVSLLWLRKSSSSESTLWEFIDDVAHAGFVDGAPVDDDRFIQGLLGGSDEFLSYARVEGRRALQALQDNLLAEGVFADPAYWYGGELFQGRQHLPRIAWLIQQARQGSPGPGQAENRKSPF